MPLISVIKQNATIVTRQACLLFWLSPCTSRRPGVTRYETHSVVIVVELSGWNPCTDTYMYV